MAAAAWDTLVHERRRGASTLSMQLLGLIDDSFERGPQGRSIMQKLDQLVQARRLEQHWSKPQILEAYLNLAAFRGELIGVRSEEHTSELQSLMRISYAVFCLKKKTTS